MAVDYAGVVECWVTDWSLNGRGSGARLWVGNHSGFRQRRPGQFTELYAYLPNGLPSRIIHGCNRWLRHHGPVKLSFGTELVFVADDD